MDATPVPYWSSSDSSTSDDSSDDDASPSQSSGRIVLKLDSKEVPAQLMMKCRVRVTKLPRCLIPADIMQRNVSSPDSDLDDASRAPPIKKQTGVRKIMGPASVSRRRVIGPACVSRKPIIGPACVSRAPFKKRPNEPGSSAGSTSSPEEPPRITISQQLKQCKKCSIRLIDTSPPQPAPQASEADTKVRAKVKSKEKHKHRRLREDVSDGEENSERSHHKKSRKSRWDSSSSVGVAATSQSGSNQKSEEDRLRRMEMVKRLAEKAGKQHRSELEAKQPSYPKSQSHHGSYESPWTDRTALASTSRIPKLNKPTTSSADDIARRDERRREFELAARSRDSQGRRHSQSNQLSRDPRQNSRPSPVAIPPNPPVQRVLPTVNRPNPSLTPDSDKWKTTPTHQQTPPASQWWPPSQTTSGTNLQTAYSVQGTSYDFSPLGSRRTQIPQAVPPPVSGSEFKRQAAPVPSPSEDVPRGVPAPKGVLPPTSYEEVSCSPGQLAKIGQILEQLKASGGADGQSSPRASCPQRCNIDNRFKEKSDRESLYKKHMSKKEGSRSRVKLGLTPPIDGGSASPSSLPPPSTAGGSVESLGNPDVLAQIAEITRLSQKMSQHLAAHNVTSSAIPTDSEPLVAAISCEEHTTATNISLEPAMPMCPPPLPPSATFGHDMELCDLDTTDSSCDDIEVVVGNTRTENRFSGIAAGRQEPAHQEDRFSEAPPAETEFGAILSDDDTVADTLTDDEIQPRADGGRVVEVDQESAEFFVRISNDRASSFTPTVDREIPGLAPEPTPPLIEMAKFLHPLNVDQLHEELSDCIRRILDNACSESVLKALVRVLILHKTETRSFESLRRINPHITDLSSVYNKALINLMQHDDMFRLVTAAGMSKTHREISIHPSVRSMLLVVHLKLMQSNST